MAAQLLNKSTLLWCHCFFLIFGSLDTSFTSQLFKSSSTSQQHQYHSSYSKSSSQSQRQSKSPAQQPSASQLQQQCLQAHNHYRKLHGAPPLVIDNKLVKFAEYRAKVMAKNNKMEHDPQGTGENLYKGPNTRPLDCQHVVKGWYDEIKFYNYNNVKWSTTEPNFHKVGHFTQLVWKKTARMGCGLATSKTAVFISCNYMDPGNINTEYEQNVAKPRAGK